MRQLRNLLEWVIPPTPTTIDDAAISRRSNAYLFLLTMYFNATASLFPHNAARTENLDLKLRTGSPADAQACGEICYRAFEIISAQHSFSSLVEIEAIASVR